MKSHKAENYKLMRFSKLLDHYKGGVLKFNVNNNFFPEIDLHPSIVEYESEQDLY